MRSDVGPYSITPEWVLDADISDRAVRLYGLLGRYANQDGEGAYPSLKALQERLRCSKERVQAARKELVGIGAIMLATRWRPNGSQTSNEYVLVLTDQQGGADTSHPTPSDTSHPQNENQKERRSRKTSSSSPPAAPERDLVWDALTATLFVPHTKHEQKRIGQAARELRAAVKLEFGDMNGALDAKCAEEIVRRMAAYPAEWSKRTPEALVKHWTDLGAGGDGAERARVADRHRRMALLCSYCGRRDGSHEDDCARPVPDPAEDPRLQRGIAYVRKFSGESDSTLRLQLKTIYTERKLTEAETVVVLRRGREPEKEEPHEHEDG